MSYGGAILFPYHHTGIFLVYEYEMNVNICRTISDKMVVLDPYQLAWTALLRVVE
jgi:hypothetical protein